MGREKEEEGLLTNGRKGWRGEEEEDEGLFEAGAVNEEQSEREHTLG